MPAMQWTEWTVKIWMARDCKLSPPVSVGHYCYKANFDKQRAAAAGDRHRVTSAGRATKPVTGKNLDISQRVRGCAADDFFE